MKSTLQDRFAELGPRLRKARKGLGLTISQVSKRASISVGSVHKIETGGRVRPETLDAYLGVVGLDLRLDLFSLHGATGAQQAV